MPIVAQTAKKRLKKNPLRWIRKKKKMQSRRRVKKRWRRLPKKKKVKIMMTMLNRSIKMIKSS
jgi:hypothetical protein